MLAQIRLLEAQVAEVDAAVTKLLEPIDQYLTTIPGVGHVLAATIRAEVGVIDRFPSCRALVAYAGLDPSVFASGQFLGKRQHLSKRGSPYLRRALCLATHTACLRNPDLNAYLQHKLAEGTPHKAALVATACKLLARISIILKEGRPVEVCNATHAQHPA